MQQQKFDRRGLGIRDLVNHKVQRRFFHDIARNPRSRVLFKNLSMLVEQTEFLLPPEFTDSITDERLKKRVIRHRSDERKHYVMWRHHLERRGELLEELPKVLKLPFQDFVDSTWLIHSRRIQEVLADPRMQLMKTFSMGAVLERRASTSLALFAEACQGKDDSVAPLVDKILRDEAFHLSYMCEELEALAGEDLRDYALYLRHKAWEVHTEWLDQTMGFQLELFVADPDFGRGPWRRFWTSLAKVVQKRAHPDDLRPMSLEEFRASSSKWKVKKFFLQLPDTLLDEREDDPGRRSGEASVSTFVQAPPDFVFAALGHLDSWHLWATNLWKATLKEPKGTLMVGSVIDLRLRGGDDMTETVVELDPVRRRSVIDAHDPPFPLHTYTNIVQVEPEGSGSRVSFVLRYKVRSNPLAAPLQILGIGRVLTRHLETDLARFKALCESPAYTLPAIGPTSALRKSA